MSQSGFGLILRTFKNRNFAIYSAGSGFSLIGKWMQRIAIGWLAFELTGEAFAVGIIAAADMFPTFIMSPISGAFADRLDRRKMLFWIQFLSMLQAIVLAVLWYAGLVTFEILVVLTAILGILTGANHPVRMAMLPSLVKDEDLPAAVAVTSVIFVAMTLLGPAVGAAVFNTFGIGVAFIANVIGFLVILVSVMMLRLPPQARAERHKMGFIGSLREGVSYVAHHPGLRAIIMITLTTSLFAWPVREMLPAIAEMVFARGLSGLTLLLVANGVGAVVAGLWIAQRGRGSLGMVRLQALGISAMVLGLTMFAVTSNFFVGMTAMLIMGGGMAIGGTAGQTMTQMSVEPTKRGRVFSLHSMIIGVGPAFGSLVIGDLADRFGFGKPLLAGAALTTLVLLWALSQAGRMRQTLEHEVIQTEPGSEPESVSSPTS